MENMKNDFYEVIKLIDMGTSNDVIELRIEELKKEYKDYFKTTKFLNKKYEFFNYVRKSGNVSETVSNKINMDRLIESLRIYRSDLKDKDKLAWLKTNKNMFKNVEEFIINDYNDELIIEIMDMYNFIVNTDKKLKERKENKITKYDHNNRTIIANLNNLVKIYKSDLGTLDKLYCMHLIYTKSSYMIDKIKKLSVELTGEELYKDYMDMYCFYKKYEENNTIKDLLEVVATKKTYNEARENNYMYILNTYLKTDDFNVRNLLEKFDLTEKEFERALFVTAKLNPEFYTKCIEKLKIDQIKRHYNTRKGLLDAINSYEAGVDSDGNKFDEIDLFKNVPFHDNKLFKLYSLKDKGIYIDIPHPIDIYFSQNLRNFINSNIPEKAYFMDEIIKLCTYKNGVNILNIKNIYEGEVTVNGVLITKEINDKILKYMRDNNLPYLQFIYLKLREIEITIGLENYTKEDKTKKLR